MVRKNMKDDVMNGVRKAMFESSTTPEVAESELQFTSTMIKNKDIELKKLKKDVDLENKIENTIDSNDDIHMNCVCLQNETEVESDQPHVPPSISIPVASANSKSNLNQKSNLKQSKSIKVNFNMNKKSKKNNDLNNDVKEFIIQ